MSCHNLLNDFCITSDVLFILTEVIMGFDETAYTVGEGDGSVRVCVLLTGLTQRNVLVIIPTEQGTAEGTLGIWTTYVHNDHFCCFLHSS